MKIAASSLVAFTVALCTFSACSPFKVSAPLQSQTKLFATTSASTEGSTKCYQRADEAIRNLWGRADLDADEIASACSEGVVWEDMREKSSVVGRVAVAELLRSQFPEGARLAVERVADGSKSAGFTWSRCSSSGGDGETGLRGTTYVRLNDEGKIECVKELAEPLVKPGDLTLKLLQAATKDVPRVAKNPTFVPATPTSCSQIVDYIWNEAYPKDGPIEESLRFYTDNIVYQDFNYENPIVGIKDVESFLRDWSDFPGIEFRVQDLSDGEVSCCFTWKVRVNGEEGPQGISFYETDGKGKIQFIRDCPAPSMKPAPLGTVASLLRPHLRVFQGRKGYVQGLPQDIAAQF